MSLTALSLRVQAWQVFFTSLALMMFEICLVRLVSVVMWYHLAFFVLAIALFGFGLGGLYAQLLRGWAQRHTGLGGYTRYLPLALSAAILLALILLAILPLDAQSTDYQVPRVRWILAVFLIGALPFLLGSLYMAEAFASRAEDASRLYFADLVGAGLGCLLAVPVLQYLGGLNAPFAASILALVPIFLDPRSRGLRVAGVAVALLAVVLCALNVRSDFLTRASMSTILTTPSEFIGWNFYSRINVQESTWFDGWRRSENYKGPLPEHRMIFQDARAPAFIVKHDGDCSKVEYLKWDVTSLPYRIADPQSVMVIGAGGGRDLLTAKCYGVPHVLGLELNEIIADDVMRGAFREFSGNVYGMPGTEVIVDSGRTFAQRTDRRFDVTLVSFADSQSSNSQGASVLTENHLFTQEAFQAYYRCLNPGGMATVASATFWGTHLLPRMFNTMRAALEAEGVAEPEKHLLAVWTPKYARTSDGMFLAMTQAPVDEAMVQRARAAVEELGYALVWPPQPEGNPWTDVLSGLFDPAEREATVRANEFDVTPLTDNRPYIAYGIRPSTFLQLVLNPWSVPENFPPELRVLHLLIDVFLVAFASVLFLMLSPLLLFKRGELTGMSGGPRGSILAICFLLGVSFVLFELALLQDFFLLLGNPTTTFALVLAVLLIFTGVGSYISTAIPTESLSRRLPLLAVGVAAAQVAVLLAVRLSMDALLGAPYPVVFAAVIFFVALIAMPMGMLFPSLLRMLGSRGIDMTCWAWGMNGIGSVLGSVSTTMISMNLGLSAVYAIGIGGYLLVAVIALGLRRSLG